MLLLKVRMNCPGGEGVLGNPIECSPELAESRSAQLLGTWIYFNPYGPTIVQLLAIPIWNSDVILVRRKHPFSPSCHAVGIAGATTLSDPKSCITLLTPLFEREDNPIIGSLPTSVLDTDAKGGAQSWLQPLFWAWCKRLQADDARKATALIEAHRTDPWEQAQVALMQELETANGAAARPAELMTPDDFAAWWEMATDPEHVRAEVTELRNAWIGAIENVQRGGKW
jgi:hypothetical protein